MSVPLRCLVLSRFEQPREMKSTDAREIASGLCALLLELVYLERCRSGSHRGWPGER
jgi:hypothetical protein